MDEGKGITFSFSDSEKESVSRNSILEARAERSNDAKALVDDMKMLKGELDSYIRAFKQFQNDYGSLSKTQQKDFNNLNSYVDKLNKSLETSNVSYTETLELVSDIAKYLDKSKDRVFEIQVAQTKSAEEYNELIQQRNELEDVYGQLVDENAVKMARHKKAQESLTDSFHNGIKNLKDSVKDIAVVSGLDNIYNSLSGNGGQLATYNNMRSQFSMTRADFSEFKRDIFASVKENGNLFKYGFRDALEAMNRLGELGITDQDMAKDQLDAIMLSTKYLGLSADTQSKILKQARSTGNMDLLNETNQTMVQIMNAQLGVSKDQLNAIVNQSSNISELSNMFSRNPNSLKNFTKSASALESVYGESASKAAMTIAEDLLNNGGNSKYISVLGSRYGTILESLQAGDGNALYDILQTVQNSTLAQKGASSAEAWAALTRSGLLDTNTAAIYNSRPINGKNYGGAMYEINAADNDTKKFLESMQEDIKSMLENVTSWVSAFIPLEGLQTLFYGLAIADITIGVGRNLLQIKGILLKQMIPGMKDLITGNKDHLALLGNGTKAGTAGGLFGSVTSALSTLTIIAGAVMAISDGISAANKAEEWGTTKGSAFLGGLIGGSDDDPTVNTLKNGGKWALTGAGIGMAVGHPVIGAIIGAVAGSIAGMIGGKDIAQAINGGSNEGIGTASAPVINSGYRGMGSPSGVGGAVNRKNFPWTLTSPFGYRGTIMTPAGPTNPYHNGIDLAHPQGTPIGANNGGKVVSAGTANDGANYVIVNSGDGYEQIYWHLMKPSHLKAGQTINAGQLIGYMGMTGQATGPHLHFGLRHAGTKNYIDPINSINSELFSPTENGTVGLGVWFPGMSKDDEKQASTTILSKMIDADTMSNAAANMTYDGVGDSDIVNSINTGFGNILQKMDELSSRQDDQEMALRILAQGKSTNLYKY